MCFLLQSKKVVYANVAIIIVITILNAFLLSGCGDSQNIESTNSPTSESSSVVHIMTSIELKHSSDEIINIAKNIIETKTNHKASEFSVIYIDYNENKTAYIVGFCIDENTGGDDIALYLSSKDLSFIRLEFGE